MRNKEMLQGLSFLVQLYNKALGNCKQIRRVDTEWSKSDAE
jgi:hypothetical protein